MEKGTLFSVDFLLAIILLLISISAVFNSYAASSARESKAIKNMEKDLFALAISDAIIKNRNELNPEKGAAFFDVEKNRIQANIIDSDLLLKIKPTSFSKMKLSAIYLKKGKEKEFIFNETEGNCTYIERAIIIHGELKSSTIGLAICNA
ncbi:MAG: hypothetical protein COV47_02200 [Candidatus Diapherotrites archaeon CG11_big_fil_rev_8_21_14_0_20_37_9]|nr:MAG: hypothetical protein COV47_02200 [Candidatus Diapherotrites archaeon CG11_big_fil_rev_8_21_14_0_20_37_9]